MADINLDAILYPHAEDPRRADHGRRPGRAQRHAVQRHRLSGGHLPGRVLRADRRRRRLGVPVGAELLGLDYTEARLLAYAYAFEQAVSLRKPPASTPALPNEP